MSLSHLLDYSDNYSTILNIGCNSLLSNSHIEIFRGLSQALFINTIDNTTNWLGGKFGSIGYSDKYVVLGNLSGLPTIAGQHINSEGSVIGFADLYINPVTSSNSNVFVGPVISNPKKLNVTGDVNVTGNYFINGIPISSPTSSRYSISIGAGVGVPYRFGTLNVVFYFTYNPIVNPNWTSFQYGNYEGTQAYDIELKDITNNNMLYTRSTIVSSGPAIYAISTGAFNNIPTAPAILTFSMRTSSLGSNMTNLQLNFN